MDQKIEYINIEDLVLWTENPRDPIDEKATDQDIVDKAINDKQSKWTLSKLSKEMGEYYDFSELPTIVYHGNKPVVYDGNRRIILGKIKHALVSVSNEKNINIPEFPRQIPCNVCSQKIALKNVFRKHSDTGSWQPLERDIFLHKFMGKEKSTLLILEEDTGIISANPHLNQRFVKEEIFNEETLNTMGFTTKNGHLHTTHDDEDAKKILLDISNKISSKKITTRKNRGKVIDVLEPSTQKTIDQNKKNGLKESNIKFSSDENDNDNKIKKRQTKRTQKKSMVLFGGPLYLRIGIVSDLYRDIVDLYKFYDSNKKALSQTFPGLIRMSLRLLCETAAKDDNNKNLDNYLKSYFAKAKDNLDKNTKTTLANQNVTESSITQLLQTGAHNYQSSSNFEQSIALSIIIGSILTITHGKDN